MNPAANEGEDDGFVALGAGAFPLFNHALASIFSAICASASDKIFA
tara:strand:- start:283 stop:420 length:138 start_codon:yes stop_codon:yes gene_type:complete